MYGAEAIASVAVTTSAFMSLNIILIHVAIAQKFIKDTYKETAFPPDHVFFDNNCRLKLHVQNLHDPWWDTVALTVDVFHFNSRCSHPCQAKTDSEAYRDAPYSVRGGEIGPSDAPVQRKACKRDGRGEACRIHPI